MLHIYVKNPRKNAVRVYSFLAGLIIFAGVALAFFTILQKSATVDETVHLASGYSYWATGDFRMNPEHPALIKEIAALPLLFFHLNFNAESPNFDQVHLWDFGPEVIFRNTVPGPLLIMVGRVTLLIFLVLLGIITYRWSKKLYGEKTALVVLFLTMTCENILAHSGLITTDVPITFSFLFACYALSQYLQKKDRASFAWFTISLALVLLVKYSAVVIAVALIAIMLVHSLLHRKNKEGKYISSVIQDFFSNKIFPLIIAAAISFVFIVFAYGGDFKTVATGADSASAEVIQDFISNKSVTTQNILHWVEKNVPFPAYHYIEGMALVLTHNKGGHTVFFLGDISNQGWWYYFPTVFLFKTSLTSLALFVGLLAYALSKFTLFILQEKRKTFQEIWKRLKDFHFDFIILSLAPIIFFAISMNSKLNLGVRYVLPVYPFLFILSGIVIQYFFKKRILRVALIIFLAASLYETIHTFPNFISYYNAFAYGNGVSPMHISDDSNLDWGQDLRALKKYMDTNHINSVYLRYFGTADPAAYGVTTKSYFPNDNDIKNGQEVSGYVVVSATALSSSFEGYTWPQLRKPIAIINGSLYVFDFDHLK